MRRSCVNCAYSKGEHDLHAAQARASVSASAAEAEKVECLLPWSRSETRQARKLAQAGKEIVEREEKRRSSRLSADTALLRSLTHGQILRL